MSSLLCPICLREYKKSKEGKRQRKLKLGGYPHQYGPGTWPAYLHREQGTSMCNMHAAEQKAKVAKAYQAREIACKALGFMSYKAYLKSDIWSSIRKHVFAESGGICFKCNGKADVVHHSSYNIKTLKGEDYSKLHAVCNACHKTIEYFRHGEKVMPQQTMYISDPRKDRQYKGEPVKHFTQEEIDAYMAG